eukprot:1874614-Prymnesium_polylepis.1
MRRSCAAHLLPTVAGRLVIAPLFEDGANVVQAQRSGSQTVVEVYVHARLGHVPVAHDAAKPVELRALHESLDDDSLVQELGTIGELCACLLENNGGRLLQVNGGLPMLPDVRQLHNRLACAGWVHVVVVDILEASVLHRPWARHSERGGGQARRQSGSQTCRAKE